MYIRSSDVYSLLLTQRNGSTPENLSALVVGRYILDVSVMNEDIGRTKSLNRRMFSFNSNLSS